MSRKTDTSPHIPDSAMMMYNNGFEKGQSEGELSGFVKGVFYALSFMCFVEPDKPSLMSLIGCAGLAFLSTVPYVLVKAFLDTSFISNINDGFIGKYKDIIIAIVLHFLMGFFIYSVIH